MYSVNVSSEQNRRSSTRRHMIRFNEHRSHQRRPSIRISNAHQLFRYLRDAMLGACSSKPKGVPGKQLLYQVSVLESIWAVLTQNLWGLTNLKLLNGTFKEVLWLNPTSLNWKRDQLARHFFVVMLIKTTRITNEVQYLRICFHYFSSFFFTFPFPEREYEEYIRETTSISTKPEALDALCELTKFSRRELRFMYREFKNECPDGTIREETFKAIYQQFFPRGTDTSSYAHFVFSSFDLESTGFLTFTVSSLRKVLWFSDLPTCSLKI